MVLKHRIAVLLSTILLLIASSGLAQTSKATGGKADTQKAAKKADLVDINSASKQELMALPGIGDAYAQKIIEGRPYRAKNQLVQKKIIPQATYDKISDKIVAKQAAADSKKK